MIRRDCDLGGDGAMGLVRSLQQEQDHQER